MLRAHPRLFAVGIPTPQRGTMPAFGLGARPQYAQPVGSPNAGTNLDVSGALECAGLGIRGYRTVYHRRGFLAFSGTSTTIYRILRASWTYETDYGGNWYSSTNMCLWRYEPDGYDGGWHPVADTGEGRVAQWPPNPLEFQNPVNDRYTSWLNIGTTTLSHGWSRPWGSADSPYTESLTCTIELEDGVDAMNYAMQLVETDSPSDGYFTDSGNGVSLLNYNRGYLVSRKVPSAWDVRSWDLSDFWTSWEIDPRYNTSDPQYGVPHVIRSVFRFETRKFGIPLQIRYAIVVRRNASYQPRIGTTSYKDGILSTQSVYTRYPGDPGGFSTSPVAVSGMDEVLVTLEDPILEPCDALGPLELSDPSWNALSWIAASSALFPEVGKAPPNGNELDAFKCRVFIFARPGNFRVTWIERSNAVNALNQVGADVVTPKEAFITGDNHLDLAFLETLQSRGKRRLEDFRVFEQLADGTERQLTGSGSFVVLRKQRAHTVWGWGALNVSGRTPTLQKQWRRKRVQATRRYDSGNFPTADSTTGLIEADLEWTGERRPAGDPILTFLVNEHRIGGVPNGPALEDITVPVGTSIELNPNSHLLPMGSLVGIFNHGDYVQTATETAAVRTAQGTRMVHLVQRARATRVGIDPNGEILSRTEQVALCNLDDPTDPLRRLSELLILPIPENPEATAFLEDIRVVPPS